MALALVQTYARSGFRVRAVFSGGNPSGQPASAFTVTRQDGGPCSITVVAVRQVDVSALEVVLSERALSGITYLLTWSATSSAFVFSTPAAMDLSLQDPNDDPDAEANGIDLAWASGDPGPGGDCPRRTGIDCVKYDLPNRAVLIPGELVQAADAGANIQRLVNSSSSDTDMGRAGSALDTEFRRDRRVADSRMEVVIGTAGQTSFNGQVKTHAGQEVPVRST